MFPFMDPSVCAVRSTALELHESIRVTSCKVYSATVPTLPKFRLKYSETRTKRQTENTIPRLWEFSSCYNIPVAEPAHKQFENACREMRMHYHRIVVHLNLSNMHPVCL